MCGRYTIAVEQKVLEKRFGVEQYGGKHKHRYNVAPTQDNPVVLIQEQGKRIMVPMKWGMIPSWAKDESIGNRMINARIETITQKPSFKSAFFKRRCLIPSDGYYEWKKTSKTGRKTPLRVVLKSRKPFAFAGLWSVWKNKAGEPIRSYTIITTAADELIKRIHTRMPVIVKPENESLWIDPEVTDQDALMKALVPVPADQIEMYEVAPLVGNQRNDVEKCIQPIKQA
jgi:putative SOS response-associated peptidase YedK